MKYPTVKYDIANFLGGLNLSVDENLLKTNETSNAENINIDKGVLTLANGYEYYSLDGSVMNIKSIMVYYRSNTPIIIVAANGGLYKYQNNKFTFIANGFKSDIWDCVNYRMYGEDVLILTNGVDNVKVYNGAIRDLKRDGNGSENSDENKAPKGKFVEVHYERLFICDDNYLYISKDFDFDDFTTPVDENGELTNEHGAYIENYTVDGSRAIGMKVVFDDVIIFKERSIYKIYGATPKTYQRQTVFNSNGAIADNSICVTNKGAYFISQDGIYLYDGVNCKLVSEKLGELFKKVNNKFLNNACGIISDNKYVLALPDKSSEKNNFLVEYDLISNVFTIKTGINVNRFAEFEDILLFVNDKGIFKYGISKTYNGEPMLSFWETPYSNLGQPNAIKEIGDCYITCYGTGQIKVSCITEKKTKSKVITLTSDEKVHRLNLNSKGRLVKFRFENLDGSDYTIKNFKTIIELDED